MDLKYLRVASVIIFCVFDIVVTVLKIERNMGAAAHLGGALNGLLMGFIVFRSEKCCIFFRTVCFCIYIILVLLYFCMKSGWSLS